MPVSRRLRYEILRRDNHTCRYCGATAPEVKLTVDHVVPTALGGTGDPSNLVAACADCNGGKSASSPDETVVEAVREDAARWAIAMQRAVAQRTLELAEQREQLEWFDKRWSSWGRGEGTSRVPVPKGGGWEKTVTRFLAAGLPVPFIEDAISITMETWKVAFDDKWRYFCGICWREVDAIQQLAVAYVQVDDSVDDRRPRVGEGCSGGALPWQWVVAAARLYFRGTLTDIGADQFQIDIALDGFCAGIMEGASAYLDSDQTGSARSKEAWRACNAGAIAYQESRVRDRLAEAVADGQE